ncbi:MAG: alpha/beta-type small acid-soluble spore protein [Clostridia bacterium]|nr:alpha/beta-type small acid-soluble spore protein [Clostridia bacterium]
MPRNTNKPAVQGASAFLDSFKYEVANELGLTNYQTIDKGSLTSRENGYVGGYMVRKMIQFAEQQLMNGGTIR